MSHKRRGCCTNSRQRQDNNVVNISLYNYDCVIVDRQNFYKSCKSVMILIIKWLHLVTLMIEGQCVIKVQLFETLTKV